MKHFYLATLALLSGACFGQNINLGTDKNNLEVTEQTPTSIELNVSLSDLSFKEVKKDGNTWSEIDVSGMVSNHEVGLPELKTWNKLIDIPYGAQVEVNISKSEFQIVDLNQYGVNTLIPVQRSISKSEDPANVVFAKNQQVYSTNAFQNNSLVTVDELGSMRGHHLGRVEICPFDYNPVQNTLKVYTNIEFEIEFLNADLGLTEQMHKKYYSPAFEAPLSKCINSQISTTKDLIVTYPVKYVIVAPSAYQADLQPLVEWKTKKGFHVVEAYTGDPAVGNTTASIKSYLEGLYTAGTPSDPAPSYVLLVGDVADMPTFSGVYGGHVTDLYYCEYDGGGDYYPEVYYGRFPATNAAELNNMINKTLQYEQYLFPDPDFLGRATMISGVDASMAPTYGNGQINYGNAMYTNLAHGIHSSTYLYPASGSSGAAILADVNNGNCFVNYTAHGYSGGWADPSFTCTDVYNMTNYHQPALMIGNCCQSNMFDDPECFGEALLRVQDRGAIGYIGGSNLTYWNEDYWWGVGNGPITANPVYDPTTLGAYDKMFHDNGEARADWHVTNAQMILGGNLAVTQAASSLEDYYYEIYHLMGDPSLMTYFGVPSAMAVTHLNAVPIGTATLQVTAEPDAYVALSLNGVLLDAQETDLSGSVTLTFPAFSTIGTADLVVTKQNKQPYIGTVQIITTNAPFVAYDNHSVIDVVGNGDNIADYNETLELDVTLSNYGMIDATGVTAQLVCTNPYITITDDNDTWGTITAGNAVTVNAAFAMDVANDVPDQTIVSYDIVVDDNSGGSWTSYFNLTVNAPELVIGMESLDDASGNGNGRLDAGEQATITLPSNNDGHSACTALTGTLSTTSPYITITSPTANLGTMGASGTSDVDFVIDVDASTPFGTEVEFTYDLVDGAYSDSHTFTMIVGLFSEDFETGDYTAFEWLPQGLNPWTIDQNIFYEGTNSSVSGTISDDEESVMEITLDIIADGEISFMKQVSSESGYDFLKFYIDNQLQGEWAGEITWSAETFDVTAGTRTFKWVYEKDYSVSEGDDAAWVDYIVFPPMQNSVGVEENVLLGGFRAYPNPSDGNFTFVLEAKRNTEGNIKVYDAQGKLLEQNNVQLSTGVNTFDFSLEDKAAGLYMIQLVAEGESIKQQVLVK